MSDRHASLRGPKGKENSLMWFGSVLPLLSLAMLISCSKEPVARQVEQPEQAVNPPAPTFGKTALEIQQDDDQKEAARKAAENAKEAEYHRLHDYKGPSEYRDPRISDTAIPQPGDNGISRRDVDLLWKGAKLVLQSRPDCTRITAADKYDGHDGAPPYYVTCSTERNVWNVFFSRHDVELGKLRP